MVVKYVERGTSILCISTVEHASIERDVETGKYYLNLMLPGSVIGVIVRGNDNVNYTKYVELINELYDTGKLDFSTNVDFIAEKMMTVTPSLLSNIGLDDLDLGDIDLDELYNELGDYDDE